MLVVLGVIIKGTGPASIDKLPENDENNGMIST